MNTRIPPFRINYAFVHPYISMDNDELVQFAVIFSNLGDADFSQVDVVTHICMVLDISGSMDVPDKYPYLLEAIPYVVNALSDNDWLSIILFSSQSELIWSNNIASSRGREQDVIQRIEHSGVKFGQTYLASGLQIAIDEIKYFYQSQSNAVTRLYILTDGQLHDAAECCSLTPELRRLEVEVNSYGFGEDFALETIQKIMEGCPGGRVKSVDDTSTLRDSFRNIGKAAANLIATDAELEIIFSPNVIAGDAFRCQPGTHWFGTVNDRNGRFHTKIGGLEKQRVYKYAFEARVYPFGNEREHIATATLIYSLLEMPQVVTQDMFVNLTSERLRHKQVNKEMENLFFVLEGLRTNNPESMLASLQARLNILRDEGGDPAQILLLEKAIDKLITEGTLEGFSDIEMRRLQADGRTTQIPRVRE